MLHLLTKELSQHIGDPFGRWADITSAIDPKEVLACSDTKLHADGYQMDYQDERDEKQIRLEHCQRIRYLMEHYPKWDPVFLDQDYQWGTVILDDGQHRLCAAVILGIKQIHVNYNGDWTALRQAFPTSYRRGLIRLKLYGVNDDN